MGWTTDREEYLRKRWMEGADARTIAIELGGITRNAVIGKIHRLGLRRNTQNPLKVSPNRPLTDEDRAHRERIEAFNQRKATHNAKLELAQARTLEDVKRLLGSWIDKGYIQFPKD